MISRTIRTSTLFTGIACYMLAGCGRDAGGSVDDQQISETFVSDVQQHAVHPWCTDEPVPVFLITPDSLGPVTRHVTREQLAVVCPTASDTVSFDAEGNEREATALRFGGLPVGVVEWSSHSNVDRVRVFAPEVRTAHGISVGSTMSAIRRQLDELEAGYDDAGVYVWSAREIRLGYLLRLNILEFLLVPDDVADNIGIIPDSAAIKEIIFDAVS